MSANQYLPIPPGLLARVCQTVTQKVSRLPFQRSSVMVTSEVIAVTLESLNAEPTRMLPLTTPRDAPHESPEGLDRIISERIAVEGKSVAPVIAEVLTGAGITEPAEVLDRHLRIRRRALKLLPLWSWHIASPPAPSVSDVTGTGGPGVESWMSLCPVCRAGALGQVTGKQLFGIPRTDYIVECRACNAKWIPVGPAFRLVSLATIRDPLWKKHLDKTYSPGEWKAIARGSVESGVRPISGLAIPPGKGMEKSSGADQLQVIKDGSLAVPVSGKILYFRPVPLRFFGGMREETFARVQSPLSQILEDPAFARLRDRVLTSYQNYLPFQTGLFLHQLRERHDPFYREFLHRYGDERFGMFRAGESTGIDRPGVLLVIVDRRICHIMDSPVSFRATINEKLGRITPETCLLNGDPVLCRINALLSLRGSGAALFSYAIPNERERGQLLSVLGEGYGKTGICKT